MSKTYQIIQGVGAVLLLVGAMLQITRWEFSPYIYIIGAVLFAYTQVMDGYDGKNLIILYSLILIIYSNHHIIRINP